MKVRIGGELADREHSSRDAHHGLRVGLIPRTIRVNGY
jgi:hypothetical protein